MNNIYSPAVSTVESRTEFLEIESVYQRKEKAPKLPSYLPIVQFFVGILSNAFPKTAAKIAFHQFRMPRIRAKHKTSDKALEAAKINEILVGSNILKVYEWGKGDKNVLLVHGWESRGTAMRAFAKPLIDKGFRVIAFDLPAHGDSSGKRTTFPECAEAISAVINRLGSVEAVITHSFGGMVLTYASRRLMPNQPIPKVIMVGVPLRFDDMLLKVEGIMNFSDKVLPQVKKIIFDIAGEYPIDMNIPMAANKTQIEELMIIHDKNDPIVDFKYAAEIHEAWTDSKLVVTEGLGHYRILKNEKVIERAVKFIIK